MKKTIGRKSRERVPLNKGKEPYNKQRCNISYCNRNGICTDIIVGKGKAKSILIFALLSLKTISKIFLKSRGGYSVYISILNREWEGK
jgi:hypothetical protein